MKVLNIESPHQLKDDTVKASIVVSEDDLIPLVQLMKDAKKGEAIELDVRKSDNVPEPDSIWEFAQRQARELEARLRVEWNTGFNAGFVAHANTTDLMAGPVEGIVDDARTDLIMEDVKHMEEKEGMCQFPDMNRDSLD